MFRFTNPHPIAWLMPNPTHVYSKASPFPLGRLTYSTCIDLPLLNVGSGVILLGHQLRDQVLLPTTSSPNISHNKLLLTTYVSINRTPSERFSGIH